MTIVAQAGRHVRGAATASSSLAPDEAGGSFALPHDSAAGREAAADAGSRRRLLQTGPTAMTCTMHFSNNNLNSSNIKRGVVINIGITFTVTLTSDARGIYTAARADNNSMVTFE